MRTVGRAVSPRRAAARTVRGTGTVRRPRSSETDPAEIVVVPSAELVVAEPAGGPSAAHALHAGFAALPIDQLVGDLIEELAGHHLGGLAPLGAHRGACDVQAPLRARDAHVGQTPLLRQLAGILQRARMRERALLQSGEEHHRILQTLGRMQGHQRHRAGILPVHRQLVGIGHQRRGLQEPRQRGVRGLLLVFGRHGLQLREVLDAGGVLGVLRALQLLQQAGLGEHLGHNLGGLAVVRIGEFAQCRHQVAERLELRGRAGGGAELVHVEHAVEERGGVRVGVHGDQ